MNIKSAAVETFEAFSQFSSLKEFNHHIEMWLLDYKCDFSKSELIGFKRLVRFAAKIPGVCNAKIATILKAIHMDYNGSGISRSTFKRMIAKAKNLGIFTVHETERKNGSQSSNLYVFNRFAANEPPEPEILTHPKETTNLLKTEKDQKITKRNEEPSSLDHTYVCNRVPKPFVEIVKCFFPEAKTIEDYWHSVHILGYQYGWLQETDLIVNLAIQSFQQLIRKMKFTGAVRKPIAYFWGILKEKFYQAWNQQYYGKLAAGVMKRKVLPVKYGDETIYYDWLHDGEGTR
ncbi:hypothetical protein [Bacillus rubiinfantis]|uniref:hypothetical protein n=1 Tax=Bacillus rubiinfantis TaxID=1499680 RepID=UPI000694BD33|nr:hypothetical protein [Bacillus rubiinfantis]